MGAKTAERHQRTQKLLTKTSPIRRMTSYVMWNLPIVARRVARGGTGGAGRGGAGRGGVGRGAQRRLPALVPGWSPGWSPRSATLRCSAPPRAVLPLLPSASPRLAPSRPAPSRFARKAGHDCSVQQGGRRDGGHEARGAEHGARGARRMAWSARRMALSARHVAQSAKRGTQGVERGARGAGHWAQGAGRRARGARRGA